jgi:hypothetical protein
MLNDLAIPVGILHSTSGTMALNETSLRDVILMEVERVNAACGLLGRPLKPAVLNPASDFRLLDLGLPQSRYSGYRNIQHAAVLSLAI